MIGTTNALSRLGGTYTLSTTSASVLWTGLSTTLSNNQWETAAYNSSYVEGDSSLFSEVTGSYVTFATSGTVIVVHKVHTDDTWNDASYAAGVTHNYVGGETLYQGNLVNYYKQSLIAMTKRVGQGHSIILKAYGRGRNWSTYNNICGAELTFIPDRLYEFCTP